MEQHLVRLYRRAEQLASMADKLALEADALAETLRLPADLVTRLRTEIARADDMEPE